MSNQKKYAEELVYNGINIMSHTNYFCSNELIRDKVELIALVGSAPMAPNDSDIQMEVMIRFREKKLGTKWFMVEKDEQGRWTEESIRNAFKLADEYLSTI